MQHGISFTREMAYLLGMRLFFILLCLVCGAAVAHAADATPAAVYFPVLPFDAPPDAAPQLVPVAASHPLDDSHAGITRAIIVIHDQTRDAAAALATMSALAGAANGSTLILAPQFLLPSDLELFAPRLPDHGRDFAAWALSGWMSGEESAAVPGHKGVSSFTVVDLLLMYLSDRNAFPDLQNIVVAGFGAGGNFVQHYAALGLAADAVARQGMRVRFVVADAAAYLYPTGNRPLGGRKGFGAPDHAACVEVNNYPYGLDNLNAYGRRVGSNAAKIDYGTRLVTYLNAPGIDAWPDVTCPALAEGNDGAARATNFNTYLQSLYGETAARTQTFAFLPNGHNDAATLFGSSCGMSALFGDGTCASAAGANP